eukprot:CAMPEP_0197852076 /NCGR_PEP_ID=MMETSP1438-20131217/19596_1 /TAXON_ID=1461541 /ORGANISM="Pterosperma sp., Strain CCMP1384" /LENGTH=228 /DNA_ID=CAMNT_0043465935 /DNA_START=8 /DNA_END=694 /DNA_ORIENTATION=-
MALLSSDHPQMWASFHSQIIMLLLDGLCDAHYRVQEAAVVAVKQMVLSQTDVLDQSVQLVQHVLPHVLASAKNIAHEQEDTPAKGLCIESAKCLDVMCCHLDPLLIVNCCFPLLPGGNQDSQDGAPYTIHNHKQIPYPNSLRCVSKASERVDQEDLMRLVPDLMPRLVVAFNSTHTEVRKATVFCIVALFNRLGEWLSPYMAGLTQSQLKLVTIYVKKFVDRDLNTHT